MVTTNDTRETQETALDNIPAASDLQTWATSTVHDLRVQIDELAGYLPDDESALAAIDQSRSQIATVEHDLQMAVSMILTLKDTALMLRNQRNDEIEARVAAEARIEEAFQDGLEAAEDNYDPYAMDEMINEAVGERESQFAGEIAATVRQLRAAGQAEAADQLESTFAAADNNKSEAERLMEAGDSWLYLNVTKPRIGAMRPPIIDSEDDEDFDDDDTEDGVDD